MGSSDPVDVCAQNQYHVSLRLNVELYELWPPIDVNASLPFTLAI